MFKNKHVIVALIVAPILAILSYLGVDRLVSEKPHAARENTSYPLAARSGCRYASGECELHNGDVTIRLTPAVFSDDTLGVRLASSIALDGAMIAMTTSGQDGVPIAFDADGQDGLEWIASLPDRGAEAEKLRLVVFTGETRFFAEIDSVFLKPDTQTMER